MMTSNDREEHITLSPQGNFPIREIRMIRGWFLLPFFKF
jgi:hypothetical protein